LSAFCVCNGKKLNVNEEKTVRLPFSNTTEKRGGFFFFSLSPLARARTARRKTPTNTRFWARDGDYHPQNENIFGLI
jgi:hypothetical protein